MPCGRMDSRQPNDLMWTPSGESSSHPSSVASWVCQSGTTCTRSSQSSITWPSSLPTRLSRCGKQCFAAACGAPFISPMKIHQPTFQLSSLLRHHYHAGMNESTGCMLLLVLHRLQAAACGAPCTAGLGLTNMLSSLDLQERHKCHPSPHAHILHLVAPP